MIDRQRINRSIDPRPVSWSIEAGPSATVITSRRGRRHPPAGPQEQSTGLHQSKSSPPREPKHQPTQSLSTRMWNRRGRARLLAAGELDSASHRYAFRGGRPRFAHFAVSANEGDAWPRTGEWLKGRPPVNNRPAARQWPPAPFRSPRAGRCDAAPRRCGEPFGGR